MVGHGSYLGQVGDADHLALFCHQIYLFRHRLGGAAGDPCVYLVKDQGVYGILLCQDGLYGKHDPGQLAAGCYGRKGA